MKLASYVQCMYVMKYKSRTEEEMMRMPKKKEKKQHWNVSHCRSVSLRCSINPSYRKWPGLVCRTLSATELEIFTLTRVWSLSQSSEQMVVTLKTLTPISIFPCIPDITSMPDVKFLFYWNTILEMKIKRRSARKCWHAQILNQSKS